MVNNGKTVAAGVFKARCLALLDEVAATRRPLIVTKRGKPVAKIVPIDDYEPSILRGSVVREGDLNRSGRHVLERRAVIVLDTHAWVWWMSDPGKLSKRARRELEPGGEFGVCAISVWEVGMLVAAGRLEFDRDVLLWVQQALAAPRSVHLPLSPEIAVRATRLDAFHGDPADRMIVATCLEYRATLLTRDRRLRDYHAVRTVW